MLCSELLDLYLQSPNGRQRKLTANLEEIWPSGALLSTDAPIHEFTPLWFVGGGCKFQGEAIAGTLFRGLGYFVEMRFDRDSRWSERKFRPQHLFNPLVLLANKIFEATPYTPGPAFAPARPADYPHAVAAPLQETLRS
ncbi:MAG: hypothetical protein M3O20_05585 [Acidobacteriota bacterium]|nr:hypothetical protein [Acidobacteriota bacterium]